MYSFSRKREAERAVQRGQKWKLKKSKISKVGQLLKQCTVCTGFDTEGEWRKSEIA